VTVFRNKFVSVFFRYTVLLFLIYLSSRWAIRLLPGNPIETLIAETGTSISAEEIAKEFHLNEPFWRSTFKEIGALVHLDFGKSLLSRQPVSHLLWNQIPNSISLALWAVLVGFSVSLILGCLAAEPITRPRIWADRICSFVGALAAALPTPWFGPILIYLFSILLPFFSPTHSLVLPVATLSFGMIGFWSRLIRNRVRETLKSNFVLAARARGLNEWKINFKYGFLPASGSLLGYLGTILGQLFAGAFITESIFNRPGLGTLMVESVLSRDYPVVQGCIFASATFCLLGNFLGEFMQYHADPRLSQDAAGVNTK
jgi:ABC-type dipeptide/oligopeptide/nickel transport system permease component